MSESLQFCGDFRERMMEWRGNRSVLGLKRKVKRVRETRIRMEECGDKFVQSGIYERDGRCFNARSKLN